jgi:hypothetical protein
MARLVEPVVHATSWCQLFLIVSEQKSYEPIQKLFKQIQQCKYMKLWDSLNEFTKQVVRQRKAVKAATVAACNVCQCSASNNMTPRARTSGTL